MLFVVLLHFTNTWCNGITILPAFYIFIKQCFVFKNTLVVHSTLLLPQNGIHVFAHPRELTPHQLFLAYQIFKSLPSYQESIFHYQRQQFIARVAEKTDVAIADKASDEILDLEDHPYLESWNFFFPYIYNYHLASALHEYAIASNDMVSVIPWMWNKLYVCRITLIPMWMFSSYLLGCSLVCIYQTTFHNSIYLQDIYINSKNTKMYKMSDRPYEGLKYKTYSYNLVNAYIPPNGKRGRSLKQVNLWGAYYTGNTIMFVLCKSYVPQID